ncbi:MAG TPA: methyltransferase domain-containing protein [Candidatus Lumbricidophila sp.]|nr:methyltransferase domain-containing protein [Candidatus Lumbricidophila sp.]
MTTVELAAGDEARIEAFAGTLFAAGLGAMELANVELGLRLGLYAALLNQPRTAADLAGATGVHPRYAREWLEQQAVAGVLDVDPAQPEADRVFTLPAAHAHVLLDDDSDACMKPVAGVIAWLGPTLELMQREFHAGRGVAFGEFGLEDIQAGFTRPVFENHLVQTWLPAIPEVQTKLTNGEPLRIAEVGCGEGLAAIRIAREYPNVTIDGYDLDPVSIDKARAAASRAGVADRVTFHLADAGQIEDAPSDLVLAIEMLHDVPNPVEVLTNARRLAGAQGVVIVVDERTEDRFAVPASELERLFYTFSTLHCLAVSMQDGGAATGTVMRSDTVRKYAEAAGFATVEVLDVEHPQFRLYRLG